MRIAGWLDGCGQIIVDECHHLSAFSFEAILKQAKAKYVVGLTATPIRRDGHQPIIFMQCGPVRHSAKRSESAPTELDASAAERTACPDYSGQAATPFPQKGKVLPEFQNTPSRFPGETS